MATILNVATFVLIQIGLIQFWNFIIFQKYLR